MQLASSFVFLHDSSFVALAPFLDVPFCIIYASIVSCCFSRSWVWSCTLPIASPTSSIISTFYSSTSLWFAFTISYKVFHEYLCVLIVFASLKCLHTCLFWAVTRIVRVFYGLKALWFSFMVIFSSYFFYFVSLSFF